MKRQKGVTLVELLVAIAVLGVVASLAVPAYRDYIATAEQGALVERINGLLPFLDQARFDTGAYPGGTYVSGGTNDFAPFGYRVSRDDDGVTLVVAAGACGNLANCFRVTATNQEGRVGVYENGVYTWP